jgi:hypothetical protein
MIGLINRSAVETAVPSYGWRLNVWRVVMDLFVMWILQYCFLMLLASEAFGQERRLKPPAVI